MEVLIALHLKDGSPSDYVVVLERGDVCHDGGL